MDLTLVVNGWGEIADRSYFTRKVGLFPDLLLRLSQSLIEAFPVVVVPMLDGFQLFFSVWINAAHRRFRCVVGSIPSF